MLAAAVPIAVTMLRLRPGTEHLDAGSDHATPTEADRSASAETIRTTPSEAGRTVSAQHQAPSAQAIGTEADRVVPTESASVHEARPS